MKSSRIAILATLILVAVTTTYAADAVNKTAATGIAIKGYDPVAYFDEGKAVKGKSNLAFEWKEARWLFGSRQHRDLFRKSPERYAPQYGGYCAFGVSSGHAAPVDPEAWKIVDGKLYLNYNKKVQELWLKDVNGFIEKADRNWPQVLDRK